MLAATGRRKLVKQSVGDLQIVPEEFVDVDRKSVKVHFSGVGVRHEPDFDFKRSGLKIRSNRSR